MDGWMDGWMDAPHYDAAVVPRGGAVSGAVSDTV